MQKGKDMQSTHPLINGQEINTRSDTPIVNERGEEIGTLPAGKYVFLDGKLISFSEASDLDLVQFGLLTVGQFYEKNGIDPDEALLQLQKLMAAGDH